MIDPSRLYKGQIVIAEIKGQWGPEKKFRPVIVLGMDKGDPIVCPITGSPQPGDPHILALPWDSRPGGDPLTGLHKKSWAVVHWIQRIHVSAVDVDRPARTAPDVVVSEVLRMRRALVAAKTKR